MTLNPLGLESHPPVIINRSQGVERDRAKAHTEPGGGTRMLYPLKKRDTRRAASVLADAFQDDPIWNAV